MLVAVSCAEVGIELTPTLAPPTPKTAPTSVQYHEFPIPVMVSDDQWQVDRPSGEMRLRFDDSIWESTHFDAIEPLFYEGGPVLIHRDIGECYLSLNVGGGVPMDWRLQTEEFQLGSQQFSKTEFRDDAGQLQFVIYDQLFRIVPGNGSEGCIAAAEEVLAAMEIED